MTWDSLVLELNTHNLAFETLGFLCCKGIATDEILIEFREHTQAGLKRSNLIGKFVTIERKTNLKAESIAASETAWLYLAAADELIPHLVCECM